jgi:bifunctional UDP-N-acetylglucosamine pyrophosphorylase/glucosamine-1-phosphate N-acetyltransferase
MCSAKPKALHECAGLPLIAHVVRSALHIGAHTVVIVVSPMTQAPVRAAMHALFAQVPIVFTVQEVSQGTEDAVRVGLSVVPEELTQAVIVYGDMPLLQQSNLEALREATRASPLALLSAHLDDPTGYDRVVRDEHGQVVSIVKPKDATPAQQAIQEVDAGVYWVDIKLLRQATAEFYNNNRQQGHCLTDIIDFVHATGSVQSVLVADKDDIRRVNDRIDLSQVERIMRDRLVRKHQVAGVTFLDPKRVFIGMDVTFAQDVTIGLDVALHGATNVAENVVIEGPTVIYDSHIETGVHVSAFSHLRDTRAAQDAVVGPYARLRAGSVVGVGAFVGNFVELKNTTLAQGAKVGHLSFVGDTEVGVRANVGGGTITCNYDGVSKHRTTIGESAFVGSNNTLVAPVTLGAGCFTAAGSTITKDVPSEALAFGRARQATVDGRAKVLRERLARAK